MAKNLRRKNLTENDEQVENVPVSSTRKRGNGNSEQPQRSAPRKNPPKAKKAPVEKNQDTKQITFTAKVKPKKKRAPPRKAPPAEESPAEETENKQIKFIDSKLKDDIRKLTRNNEELIKMLGVYEKN